MVLASNHTWGDKFENGFQDFFNFIPNLLGFLVLLLVGYVVAKVIGGGLARLLHHGGLDRTLMSGGAGRWIAKLTASPSRLLGRLAFWVLFLGAVALAVSVLGIEALTDFVGEIFAYLPNVIAALLIFVVAGAIAAGVGALVGRAMGDTPTGRVVGSIAPVLIMVIAVFMILDQLRIAEDIVETTFQALMFGTALALALAFGLGGRDVAARMLEGAYQTGQESREQIRRDIQQGKERAKEDLQRAREAAEQRPEREEAARPPEPTLGPAAGARGGATQRGVGASTGAGTTPGAGGMVSGGATTRGRPPEPPRPETGPTREGSRGARATGAGESGAGGDTEKIERVRADEIGKVPPGSADDVTSESPDR